LGFRLRAITAITRDYGDPRSVPSVLISGKPLPFNFGDFWQFWQFWQSLLIRDHPRQPAVKLLGFPITGSPDHQITAITRSFPDQCHQR
jgi:hypothetical protein